MNLRLFNLRRLARRAFVAASALGCAFTSSACTHANVLPTTDGFYGIWYAVDASGDQYAYKYSGGFATYPQQTSPLAIYAAAVNRTYFLYSGTDGTNNSLSNYISYYDHTTGLLARPRELRDVGGNDAHKNAVLTIDDNGYLNVFGNSHGNAGTGNYFRSSQPYSINDFNEIALPGSAFNNSAGSVKLAYSNAYYVSGSGYMLIYNDYDDGRAAHVATSADGLSWTDKDLFDTEQGHYTVARQNGNTIGVTADYHRNGSLDHRTNLYYFQTNNFGQTWTNVAGATIATPVVTRDNAGLVHDYYAENQLVYMKDIDYDAAGNPILLYLTVSDATGTGYRSGPQPGGRTLHTAYWTGGQWQIRDVLTTDHNYDHGELYVEQDGSWRITGPFINGPQVYGTGGEVGSWTSQNQGASWQLVDQLTANSTYNHTYVRIPVNANDDFFSYWADGNAFAQSESRLYFANKNGTVYRMPTHFTSNFAAPELFTGNPDPPPIQPPTTLNHTLLGSESFDYPNTGSSQLAGKGGGVGWGGPWAVTTLGTGFTLSHDDVSLTSPAFPLAAAGDRILAAGAGTGANVMRVYRPLANTFDMGEEGALYASFMLRKNGSSTATSSNNIELNLTQGDAGNGTIRFGSTSTNGFFVWDSSSVGSSFENVVLGQNYFIVLKVVAHAESDDTVSALVFGSTEAVPTLEPVSWDAVHTLNSSALIDRVRLWIGTFASGQFDEIRLGTSWATVIGRLAGDSNADGKVDIADYVLWRKANGSSQQNYLEWRSHYGEYFSTGFGSGTSDARILTVPEPNTLFVTAFVIYLSAMRRKDALFWTGARDTEALNLS